MIALLTSEALQVINVSSRAHHHLECWNNFAAGCAVTSISEKSVKHTREKTIITVSNISSNYARDLNKDRINKCIIAEILSELPVTRIITQKNRFR